MADLVISIFEIVEIADLTVVPYINLCAINATDDY